MTTELSHYLAITLPSLNEVVSEARRNRYQGARQKRNYTNAVSKLCAGLPRLTGRYVWRFTWYRRDKRTDPDNIASGVKFIFDGLQQAGVIDNDGWGQVAEITHRFVVAEDEGVLIEALDDAQAEFERRAR